MCSKLFIGSLGMLIARNLMSDSPKRLMKSSFRLLPVQNLILVARPSINQESQACGQQQSSIVELTGHLLPRRVLPPWIGPPSSSLPNATSYNQSKIEFRKFAMSETIPKKKLVFILICLFDQDVSVENVPRKETVAATQQISHHFHHVHHVLR